MHVNNILTLQFQKNSKSRNIKLLTVYLCIIIDHFNISVHYQRSTCISCIGSHAVVCSVWSGVWSGSVDILIGVIMNSMVQFESVSLSLVMLLVPRRSNGCGVPCPLDCHDTRCTTQASALLLQLMQFTMYCVSICNRPVKYE